MKASSQPKVQTAPGVQLWADEEVERPLERRSDSPSAPATLQEQADIELRRYRERISARLATVVIAGTGILIGFAVWYTSAPDSFARVKDLLLFINPLLGVVLGYYFTKTTTETRAEQAETTAKHASMTAQRATQERDQATAEKTQAIDVLSQLEKATSQHLAYTSAQSGGTLHDNDDPGVLAASDPQLLVALERARRTISA